MGTMGGMSAVIAGGPAVYALMPPLGCVLCHAWACPSEHLLDILRHSVLDIPPWNGIMESDDKSTTRHESIGNPLDASHNSFLALFWSVLRGS